MSTKELTGQQYVDSGHEQRGKFVTIVVNGMLKKVQHERLTFEDVVALAFEIPPNGEGVQFTVQYTRGHSNNSKGSLVEGQSVQVKEGMEFDVTSTNRS